MAINENLVFEDAKIILRNFSGRERKFNPAGNRNFGVLLTPERAQQLLGAGWRVKQLAPKDPADPPALFLPVSVMFGQYPPKIVKCTSHNKVVLSEKTVGTLDTDEIVKADLVVRPYNWTVQGNTGVKAYLKVLYVTIAEDVFESKYYETPDVDDTPF